jgi:thioredoxin 1
MGYEIIMNTVVNLTEANFESELKKHPYAIVDYFASWCGSCRLFAPTFAKVAGEISELPFFKVDGDANPKTREGLSIDNLPFVALFENGQPIGGLNITTEDALREFVKRITDQIGASK